MYLQGSARIVRLWHVTNVIDIDMRDATEKSSSKTLGLQFGKRPLTIIIYRAKVHAGITMLVPTSVIILFDYSGGVVV